MPTNAKKIRIGGVSHDIEDTQARSDISALKSNLSETISIDLGDWVDNSYVRSTGLFNKYIGWHRTGYVEIPSGVKTIHFTNTENVENIYNCFYDSSFLKVGQTFDTNNKDIEVPNDAVYFAVSLDANYIVEASCANNEFILKEIKSTVDEVKSTVGELKNDALKIQYVRNAYKYRIPSYFIENDTDHVLYLNSKFDTALSNNDDVELVFFSDPHWKSNIKNSQYLIPYTAFAVDATAVVNGGDVLDQESSASIAEYEYKKFASLMVDTFIRGYRFVFGNHDLNTANASTRYPDTPIEDLALSYGFNYDQSIKPWSNELTFSVPTTGSDEFKNWNRMHYYWDDTKNKIRFLVVNTGNTYQPLSSELNNASGLSELYIQIPWVYDRLMELDDGWSVLVFGHKFFTDNTEEPTSVAQSLARMLNAAQLKSSECKLGGNAYLYISNTWDLSNIKNVNVIGMWCGHDHTDGSCVFTGVDTSSTFVTGATDASAVGSILIARTATDAKNSVHTGITMTEDTTTEQCFDILGINKNLKTIHATRIGAGSDRVFEY